MRYLLLIVSCGLALILSLASCSAVIKSQNTVPICIQVLDDSDKPITDIYVKVLFEKEEMYFNNCIKGTIVLNGSCANKRLYIKAPDKLGIILDHACDTVVHLHSKSIIKPIYVE